MKDNTTATIPLMPAGRPPKPAAERADLSMQLRITAAQRAAWRKAAKSSGMKLAAWVKAQADKSAK